MKDVLADIDDWQRHGRRVALATVVAVRWSAPRPPGAKLAVADDGRVAGMISGGCVEGAVVAAADELLAGGPPRLLHFGLADAEAWEVGLPCGGEIDVWLDRFDDAPSAAFAALAREDRRGALVTRLDDGRRLLVAADGTRTGTIGPDDLAARAADEAMWDERSGRRDLDGVPVLVDVTAPAPRLIVIGAIALSEALARQASLAGWRPFVIDPRDRFATAARCPSAERVVAAWPDAGIAELGGLDAATSVVILTHDPKIDDAALAMALDSDAPYIGAMGSRRMQADRRARLLDSGCTDADLDRISGPVGLDLGALTLEETALSIMAEVVAVRRGHAGGRLRDSQADRIHTVESP